MKGEVKTKLTFETPVKTAKKVDLKLSKSDDVALENILEVEEPKSTP